PFVVVTVDLFARCGGRKIPVAPPLRAYRSRVGFWLWVAATFLFLGLIGVWPGGGPHPINPETNPAGNWPALGLILLVVLAVPGWLVSRSPLAPRQTGTGAAEIARPSTAK